MQEISGSQLIGLGPSCALIGTVTVNECASIAAWLEQNKVRYISMPFLNESTLQTAPGSSRSAPRPRTCSSS